MNNTFICPGCETHTPIQSGFAVDCFSCENGYYDWGFTEKRRCEECNGTGRITVCEGCYDSTRDYQEEVP